MKELKNGTKVKVSSGEIGEVVGALYNWKKEVSHYIVRVQATEGEKEVKFEKRFVQELEE